MNENFDQSIAKSAQKTVISDTGSGILAENQANPVEKPKAIATNVVKVCSDSENAPNCEKHNDSIAIISENGCESAATKQKSVKNEQNSTEIEQEGNKIGQASSVLFNHDGDLSLFYNIASENELKNSFPAVDIGMLRENKEFNSLLLTIMKNPTLSDIYACYNAIISQSEENSRLKLAQALANADTSVGALASTEGGGVSYFTKEQVLKMSPAQIKQNFKQIRESQGKW